MFGLDPSFSSLVGPDCLALKKLLFLDSFRLGLVILFSIKRFINRISSSVVFFSNLISFNSENGFVHLWHSINFRFLQISHLNMCSPGLFLLAMFGLILIEIEDSCKKLMDSYLFPWEQKSNFLLFIFGNTINYLQFFSFQDNEIMKLSLCIFMIGVLGSCCKEIVSFSLFCCSRIFRS